MTDKYAPQKKYLQSRKRLSVWVEAGKYKAFKDAVQKDGNSIYGLINSYIDKYLNDRTS